MVRTGSCRCGQVGFRITQAPVMAMACHCRGCQKMTSSAFSLTALVPVDGFEVTAGEPVIGGLHGPSRQYFCPNCMSWLYTQGDDGPVGVRTPMLDDPSGLEPFIEFVTADKLPWAGTPAAVSFDRVPEPSEWAALIQRYQEHSKALR
jgi:hypothetical protein